MNADCSLELEEMKELERMIKCVLHAKGPMPFAGLHLEIDMHRSIQPYALHDLLNSMIVVDLVTLDRGGKYILA